MPSFGWTAPAVQVNPLYTLADMRQQNLKTESMDLINQGATQNLIDRATLRAQAPGLAENDIQAQANAAVLPGGGEAVTSLNTAATGGQERYFKALAYGGQVAGSILNQPVDQQQALWEAAVPGMKQAGLIHAPAQHPGTYALTQMQAAGLSVPEQFKYQLARPFTDQETPNGVLGPRPNAPTLPPGGRATPTGPGFEPAMNARESSNNPQADNGGYAGLAQFGAPRMAALGFYTPGPGENISGGSDAWKANKAAQWSGTLHDIPGHPEIKTIADFKNSPDAQHAAFGPHVSNIDAAIAATPGADKWDKNGLRAVAHIGGNDGMRNFVSSNGKTDPGDNPKTPGGGTHLSDYYREFSQGGTAMLQQHMGPPARQGMAPGQPATARVAVAGPGAPTSAPPAAAAAPAAPAADIAAAPALTAPAAQPAPAPAVEQPNALLQTAAQDQGAAPSAPNSLAAPQAPGASPVVRPGTPQAAGGVAVQPPALAQPTHGQYVGPPVDMKSIVRDPTTLLPISGGVEGYWMQRINGVPTPVPIPGFPVETETIKGKDGEGYDVVTKRSHQLIDHVDNLETAVLKSSPRTDTPEYQQAYAKLHAAAVTVGRSGQIVDQGMAQFRPPTGTLPNGQKADANLGAPGIVHDTFPEIQKIVGKDEEETGKSAAAANDSQVMQTRLLKLRDIAATMNSGSYADTRLAMGNFINTFGGSLGADNVKSLDNMLTGGTANMQIFDKLQLLNNGLQEKATMGSRGGAFVMKMFGNANPSKSNTPEANQKIINQQLVGTQADLDYSLESRQFFSGQLERWKKTQGKEYARLDDFDQMWQRQRNPQVYMASAELMSGDASWARGLSADEQQRAHAIVGRINGGRGQPGQPGAAPSAPSAPAGPPSDALDLLRTNPSFYAPHFDEKYGAGAAKRALGQ